MITKSLQVFEVFEAVEKAKTKKDRVDLLKQYENWAIKDVIRGIFDERIKWKLPGGDVPYTPSLPESVPSSLLKQNVKFKYFVEGVADCERLIPVKREQMFISMLETVHPEDAKLLVSMINKKNPVKGLTKPIVKEAYPNLIP